MIFSTIIGLYTNSVLISVMSRDQEQGQDLQSKTKDWDELELISKLMLWYSDNKTMLLAEILVENTYIT